MDYGPCIPLAVEMPTEMDFRQAARYLGAPGEPDPQTLALLRRCAPALAAACRVRAVCRAVRCADLEQAGLWQGEDIARHLSGCEGGVLLAVTLGPGVDGAIRRAGVGDVAAGAAADALASALAEQAADAAQQALVRLWEGRGLYLTGRYSPGYGDWPLTVQPALARLLDTPRQIGLCIQDNGLMTPRKSVTALLGLAGHPVQGHRAGCSHCALRDRCEYRRRGQRCED